MTQKSIGFSNYKRKGGNNLTFAFPKCNQPRKLLWPLRLATFRRDKTNTFRSKCQGGNCNNVRSMTKQGNITSIIRTYKPKRKSDLDLAAVNQGNITYIISSSVSICQAIRYVSVCGT